MQIKPGTKFKSVDEYLSAFPVRTKKVLQQVRSTIKKAAPNAEEVISYNMPAFKFKSVLVYYAGYDNHIGFYPTASGIENFKKEFAIYKWSKGAVQFPLDEPMPLKLITKIVQFRVNEVSKKNKEIPLNKN